MHTLQEKLLKAIGQKNLSGMTLREIGALVGEKSAQKIKHHLSQLAKRGLIAYDSVSREVKKASQISQEGFISLPLVGSANCGPATIFADQNITGYLKVSKKMAPRAGKLFVVRAEGNSMNRANIKAGKAIDDGDFVIVDAAQRMPEAGHYVVSVIDGVANIKKFVPDKKNERIILQSESSSEHLPIFIHEDDEYLVSGRVVDVIKK